MTYFDGIVYGTPEIGWSSEHTASGPLWRPYPRVYEHDVVRDYGGRTGTIVWLHGPWIELEHDDGTGDPDFWEIRLDDIAAVVWSRP